jgi:serine/threonine protein kinase
MEEKNLFSEKEILRFLANIIMVTFEINSRNIYHRDLKPENFLIKRDKIGLIYLHLNDFGTAKSSIIDEIRNKTNIGDTIGTTEYMAPEIINAKTEIPDITK